MRHKGQTVEWAQYMRALGDNLSRIRQERGLSQERVAAAAGMSRFTYQRMERAKPSSGGTSNPTLITLVSLCQVLDVTLVELLPKGPLPDPGSDGHIDPELLNF